MNWFRMEGDAWLLSLHVQPGTKQSEIAGLHGDALKIRLAAPPVEGRANEALLKFIAEKFEVPPRNVELVSGAASRRKRLRVRASTVSPHTLLEKAD